ncbi:hypothetical protein AGMMS50230_00260 [Spirochaetia bacterium]|nr:hypothetical protein AGMMS50230_00260 [Spirochaetia bacterium]
MQRVNAQESASAQEKASAQESAYYVKETFDGVEFVQRLSWPGDENAFQYELIIEQPEQGEAYRTITKFTFAEFSLPPGNYRYRVVVYNLLRQPESVSAWKAFTILPALQPEITAFSPRFFDPRQGQITITIEGQNLLPDAEVSLERKGISWPPRLYQADPSGERAVLVYDELPLGAYTIRIKNPGGFETSRRGFEAGAVYRFQLLFAYAPVLPLGGYLFRPFDNFIYPAGAQMRAAGFFLQGSWGSLGAETVVSWAYLKDRQNSAAITAHVGEAGLNILYRWNFNPRLALKARVGGGLAAVVNLSFDFGIIKSPAYHTFSLMAEGGLSLEWRFYRAFYAELGADYIRVFSKDTARPSYLRPFAGLGWQF